MEEEDTEDVEEVAEAEADTREAEAAAGTWEVEAVAEEGEADEEEVTGGTKDKFLRLSRHKPRINFQTLSVHS